MGFLYTPLESKNRKEWALYKKKIDKVYKKTESIRGYIITSSIELEWHIDSLIISYYIKTGREGRHIKFKRDLLDSLNLAKKINILEGIGLHKKMPFKKKYANFIKRLDNIRLVRNKIAHKGFYIGQNIHMYIDHGVGKKKRFELINNSYKNNFKKEVKELMFMCSELDDYIRNRDNKKKKF